MRTDRSLGVSYARQGALGLAVVLLRYVFAELTIPESLSLSLYTCIYIYIYADFVIIEMEQLLY